MSNVTKHLGANGPLALFTAALIWGTAFVAQAVGMENIGPFTFNGIRTLVGAAFLAVVILLRGRAAARNAEVDRLVRSVENGERTAVKRTILRSNHRELVIGGIVCGILLAIAGNLQQIGIATTAVGKAGFLTALYIVLVPLVGIFFGKRPGLRIWAAVVLALGGLYLLTLAGSSDFSFAIGDVYLLLSALGFAFQITAIDHFSYVDSMELTCVQMLVSGLITVGMMFIKEQPTIAGILAATVPILYCGICSSGIAYTLQAVGQRNTPPAIASLIMSLEAVISVLAGWILLHQKLTGNQLAGCAVMFAAVILAQLPSPKRNKE